MNYLQVREINEKLESGATEPHYCRLSDERLYVVKGRAALARGLIAETVCATLGRAYGLPIPDFAIARADPRLLHIHESAQRTLGSGFLFASLFCKGTYQVTRNDLEEIDLDILKRIFLFDYWVGNADRTGTVWGGNSNLLKDFGRNEIIVVDHNLSFDPQFSCDEFQRLHICRDFWANHRTLLIERDALIAEMDSAASSINDIEDDLPEEWLEAEPDMLGEIRTQLNLRHDNAFWAPL